MQESKNVIISLHPEHANKILSGEKKLEFRRVWANKPVNAVVIYSTVPVKKIVAIAYVKQVHCESRNRLWALAKSVGGGLTRRALYGYFEGKKQGYAVEFDSIKVLNPAISPATIIENFRAPQSFAYLDQKILKKLESFVIAKKEILGKTIFVAGVHGVGKTSMCQDFAQRFGFAHKSAGQLIRESKVATTDGNSKAVKDIDGDQQLLIQAVSKIRTSGESLLLDGHFAVLNSEHLPTALVTNVFANLNIDAIIAIFDEPAFIAARMTIRDGINKNESDVNALQSLELDRARQVASELNLPLVTLKAFDQNGFDDAVYIHTL